jgi:hypothetical protein
MLTKTLMSSFFRSGLRLIEAGEPLVEILDQPWLR